MECSCGAVSIRGAVAVGGVVGVGLVLEVVRLDGRLGVLGESSVWLDAPSCWYNLATAAPVGLSLI